MPQSPHHFFKGTRAYLSGPMDFVSDRETEKLTGWRVRMKAYLQSLGVTVFDPWEKPRVRGLHEYGKEDLKTIQERDNWQFDPSQEGANHRAQLAEFFWETMHVDLRMVDLSDFVIAYCPTNVYSVGTVHEIVVARQQHKPVLFVSPPVTNPALHEFEQAVEQHSELSSLWKKARSELVIKENPKGIPSLWYMPLISSESFFDGFGFYLEKFHTDFPNWKNHSALDAREATFKPSRPLLPYLNELAQGKKVPKTWDHARQGYRDDDDWLLLEEAMQTKES